MLSDRDRRILREMEEQLGRSDQRFVSSFALGTDEPGVDRRRRFARPIAVLAVVTVLLLLVGFASIALITGSVVGLLVLLSVLRQGRGRGVGPEEPHS